MHSIATIDGRKIEVECIACAISNREIDVLGGVLAESEHFGVSQDFEYPISGFLIIHSKKHVRSAAEFTPEETRDFGSFLAKVRVAMKSALGIEKITLIQEEKSDDSHFHVWLFPWHEWMREIGTGISSIRPIMQYASDHHKTEETLRQIRDETEKVKNFLAH